MGMFMTLAFTGQKVSNYIFSDMQLIIYEYCIYLHKAIRGWVGRGGKEQQEQQATRAIVTAWRIFPKTNKSKKVWDIAKSRTFLGGKFTASNEYTRKAIKRPSIHLKKFKKKSQLFYKQTQRKQKEIIKIRAKVKETENKHSIEDFKKKSKVKVSLVVLLFYYKGSQSKDALQF